VCERCQSSPFEVGLILRIILMKKNRVEPAQPDFFQKNGLSRLNPNCMNKNRVEPAQPDFDQQCAAKTSVLTETVCEKQLELSDTKISKLVVQNV